MVFLLCFLYTKSWKLYLTKLPYIVYNNYNYEMKELTFNGCKKSRI